MKLNSSRIRSLFSVFVPPSSNSLVCKDERDKYMMLMAISYVNIDINLLKINCLRMELTWLEMSIHIKFTWPFVPPPLKSKPWHVRFILFQTSIRLFQIRVKKCNHFSHVRLIKKLRSTMSGAFKQFKINLFSTKYWF